MANGAVDDALIMLVFYHDAVATVNQAGNISLYIEIRRKHALRVRPVRNYRPWSRCCIPPVSGPSACTCRPAPQRPDLQQRMLLIKSGSDFLEQFALLYLLYNQHSFKRCGIQFFQEKFIHYISIHMSHVRIFFFASIYQHGYNCVIQIFLKV